MSYDLDALKAHAEYGHLNGEDYDAVEWLVDAYRELRAAIAEHRRAVETDTGLDPKFYEADDRRLWAVLDD